MSCKPKNYSLGKICNPISNRWVNANSFTGKSLRIKDEWLSSLNTDLYMFTRPYFIKFFKQKIPEKDQLLVCLSDLNMFVRPSNFLYQNYCVILIDQSLKAELSIILINLTDFLNQNVETNILKIIFHNHNHKIDLSKPLQFEYNIDKHQITLKGILIVDILFIEIDKSQITNIDNVSYLNYLSPEFLSIYKQLTKELPLLPNNCSYLTQFIDPKTYNFNNNINSLPSKSQTSIVSGLSQCLSDILYGPQTYNNLFNLSEHSVIELTNALTKLRPEEFRLIYSYTKHSKTLNINLINYYETHQNIFLKPVIYDENIAPTEYMSYQHPLSYVPHKPKTTLYNGLDISHIYISLNSLIDNMSQQLYKSSTLPLINNRNNNLIATNNYVYHEDYFYIYSIRSFVGIMNDGYVFNPNFVSCTYRSDVGINWLVSSGQMCCLFIIRVKKGDKFLLIGSGLNDLYYGDESEILLKAGSFFKITSTVNKSIYNNQINDFLIYYVDYICDQKQIYDEGLYKKFEVPTQLQWTTPATS